MPIVTPKTVIIGWMLPTLFAIMKRKTLSILIITAKPKTRMAHAPKLLPLANCKSAAGTKTTGGPRMGRKR